MKGISSNWRAKSGPLGHLNPFHIFKTILSLISFLILGEQCLLSNSNSVHIIPHSPITQTAQHYIKIFSFIACIWKTIKHTPKSPNKLNKRQIVSWNQPCNGILNLLTSNPWRSGSSDVQKHHGSKPSREWWSLAVKHRQWRLQPGREEEEEKRKKKPWWKKWRRG